MKFTINGAVVRFRLKWADESDCVGGTVNKQADAFITGTNTPASATITGLTHLIGESVVVWADGICLADADGDIATFVVSGAGEITVTHEGVAYLATSWMAGLSYTAQWKSGKLVQIQAQLGTPLTMHKQIQGLGIIATDLHPKGLQYGKSFDADDLMDMPTVEGGETIDPDTMRDAYDEPPFTFPGAWSTDSRLCLQAQAPRPATVLAAVCLVDMVEE